MIKNQSIFQKEGVRTAWERGGVVCGFVERTLVRYGWHEIIGLVSSGLKSALQWLVMCMVEFLDWRLCVVN